MFVNNTDNTVNFMKKNTQVIIMIALLLTDTIHKHINWLVNFDHKVAITEQSQGC